MHPLTLIFTVALLLSTSAYATTKKSILKLVVNVCEVTLTNENPDQTSKPLPPNRADALIQVISKRPADDGWGGWATVVLLRARSVRGELDLASAAVGETFEAFAAPSVYEVLRPGGFHSCFISASITGFLLWN